MLAKLEDTFEETGDLAHLLIANVVDGLLVLDSRSRIRIFNPACERLFGYRSDEVVGANVMLLIPDAERADFGAEGMASPFELTDEPIVGNGREAVGKRKDQSIFPMCVSVGLGELQGRKTLVCIINDLTNRKLDSDVRERERRLNAILDSVPDAVVVFDEAGTIKSFSAAASTIFGYEASAVVGYNVAMLMPARHHMWPPADDRRMAGTSGRVVIGQRRDGSKFPLEIAIGEISGGKVRLFTAFLRDLARRSGSEQRIVDLQAELLHASRLSTMGHMSAAIAHEINQPLTAISNYVNAAKRLLHADAAQSQLTAQATTLLDKAAVQSLRASDIVRKLREFVEKRTRCRRPEDLGVVIEEAVALAFVGASEKSIKMEVDLDPSLGQVEIDKVQIQQVLINLVRNSIDAMQPCSTRELHLTASGGERGFVDVTVRDTGPGMPDHVAARLFQPFLTTKDRGMGVGLTICQSIVEAHGGRIWLLESSPAGTAFRFQLPLCRPAQAAA